MSGRDSFYAALVNKLRDDTVTGGLVELTGHSPSVQAISRAWPEQVEKVPFLGVGIVRSSQVAGNGPTQVQRVIVSVCGYAKKEVDAIRIANRVEFLLHQKDKSSDFYDFSDANIRICGCVWQGRGATKYNKEKDRWEDSVIVEVIANFSSV